ncbi:MAG: carboxypeptidase-like regulatory domain-containing protein [Cyclobacteriaceae bacterium]
MKRALVVLVTLGLINSLQAQQYQVAYVDAPLNEVLLDLNTRYDVQISVNADLSAGCLVSLSEQFTEVDDLLAAIANVCEMELAAVNGVYSFRKMPTLTEQTLASEAAETADFLYQGMVVEAQSGEPIPFASILAGNAQTTSDGQGIFTVKLPSENVRFQALSLGYNSTDTTVSSGNDLVLTMTSEALVLEEVIVEDAEVQGVTNIGQYAGHYKMNDVSNQLIPGQNVNAVFNNIKMYPGITSSGESLSDYLIWGSYTGQNLTLFDDITIFNSWGINDDIGRINPLMVKNIEVYKGGYEADYGDRVGGLIRIDGRQGNLSRPTGQINISNQLAMAHLSIPLFQKSSVLQVAGRQSYFDALDWSGELENDPNGDIIPSYQFQDINAKWTTQFSNGDRFQVSAIHSQDDYLGEERIGNGNRTFQQDTRIESTQTGVSAKYVKQWKRIGISSLTYSQSAFEPQVQVNFLSSNEELDELRSSLWLNTIKERSLMVVHQFPLKGNVQYRTGMGWVNNSSSLNTTNLEFGSGAIGNQLDRYFLYANADWQAQPNLLLKWSARADVTSERVYFQPRISAIWDAGRRLSINAAWGKYHQFINHVQVLDFLGNTSNFWQVADLVNEPAVEAYHYVLGSTYRLNDLIDVNMTGYFIDQSKATSVIISNDQTALPLERQSRSYGLDIFTKLYAKQHQLLISYALNRVDESYLQPNGLSTANREAPQSQRHEVKAAGIFKLDHLSASITSVFGSGFPLLRGPISDNASRNFNQRGRQDVIVDQEPYWRTDLAFEYAKPSTGADWAFGVSLINIFNQRNIHFNQSVIVADETAINTLGTPFTPTVYMKMTF